LRQRPGRTVDQEQLQLGTQGGRAHPEAGPRKQPAEGRQALGEPLLEAGVVKLLERLLVDA
jgi:hypothetical protein